MYVLVHPGVDGDVKVGAGKLIDETNRLFTESGFLVIENQSDKMFAGAAGRRVSGEGEAGEFLFFAVVTDKKVTSGAT